MARCPSCIKKLLIAVAILATETLVAAQQAPPEEGKVIYQPVPDITLQVSTAQTIRLSQPWGEKPLLITLIFSRCAGICSPFLRSLGEATEQVGGAGTDYDVVVLSFDPDDTLEDMQSVAKANGIAGRPGWLFGVASTQDVRQLADSIGFWFRKVEGTIQYDHPAMLVGVRRGRILRVLVGANVSPRDLRLVIQELQGEVVLSYALPDPRIPFRCFDYDPRTGRSRLDWGMLVLVAPSFLAVVTVLSLFTLARPHNNAP